MSESITIVDLAPRSSVVDGDPAWHDRRLAEQASSSAQTSAQAASTSAQAASSSAAAAAGANTTAQLANASAAAAAAAAAADRALATAAAADAASAAYLSVRMTPADQLLSALSSAGAVVVLKPETYLLNEPLVLPSRCILHLNGATLDFSSCSTSPYIKVHGTAGTAVALSADAMVRTNTVSLTNVDGIAVGQMLRLYSARIFDPGRTNSRAGELVTVESISGSVLTVDTKLCDTYLIADQSYVEPITAIEDVVISGMGTIRGNSADQTDDVGIEFWRARHCRVEGVRLSNIDAAQIRFRDSMHCHADRTVHGRTRPNVTGYGISFMDATQDCSSVGCTFRQCRHSLSTNNTASYGGIPRRITFERADVYDSAPALGGSMGGGDAIDTHAAAEDIWIKDCTVRGSSGQGINIECRRAIVRGCDISDCASNGIGVHNEVSGSAGEIEISGCRVRNATGIGISVMYGNTSGCVGSDRVMIVDCDVASVSELALQIRGTTAYPARNVTISGGRFESGSSALAAVYLSDCYGISINDVIARSSATAQAAIRVLRCASGQISNNRLVLMPGSSAPGIDIRASGLTDVMIVVDGNVLEAPSQVSAKGLFIDSTVTGITVGDANDFTTAGSPTSGPGLSSFVLASDTLTLSSRQSVVFARVDTEGLAATDDLITIVGGRVGTILILQSISNARDVIVRETGNVRLGGADVALNNGFDALTLVKGTSYWMRMAAADNGA